MVPSCAKESERYELFHHSVIISSSFFNIILRATFPLFDIISLINSLLAVCNIKTAVDKEISS